jgi:hypothetical protein
MENVKVPDDYARMLETKTVAVIGPPPGVSREHCVDAEVAITQDWVDDGMGLGWVVFFKPSDDEIKNLQEGGLLKVTLRGDSLVPHSLGSW